MRFHATAGQWATSIEQGGLEQWELRPEGHAPIGIAAAIYALSGIHEPWVVSPVNAGLYAMAAVFLWHGMQILTGRRAIALAALLPALLFPSTAMIWRQIHKDVWMLAGAMGFVWALTSLGRERISPGGCLVIGGVSVLSTLLIWVMRPYANTIFLASGVLGVIVLTIFLRPRRILWRLAAGGFLVAQVATITFIEHAQAPAQTQTQEIPCHIWQQQPPVPLVDKLLEGLACAREGFRLGYPDAGSNIDTEVGFRNTRDIVAYLPRALQIALFAPFPSSMWTEEDKQPGGALKRLLTIPETIARYLAIAGCVLALDKSQTRERAIRLYNLFSVKFPDRWS